MSSQHRHQEEASTSIEQLIVDYLQSNNEITNSRAFARTITRNHEEVVGALKSLESTEVVTSSVQQQQQWECTEEGKLVLLEGGSPEFRVLKAVMGNEGGRAAKENIVVRVFILYFFFVLRA